MNVYVLRPERKLDDDESSLRCIVQRNNFMVHFIAITTQKLWTGDICGKAVWQNAERRPSQQATLSL